MATLNKQKITPYLWFDQQAREAANFYCSLFENSGIISDSGMVVEFMLDGMSFIGLNGGPRFKFTEAISFMVTCKDQEEVDHFWYKLTADGGEESRCSWCRDKYGLWWQIVPARFFEMMKTGTPEQRQSVMDTMLSMKKLVVADFEAVFN